MTGDRSSLTAAAASRIHDTGRRLLPEERETATALLADLYAAGLRHGISPQDWSWVGSLGNDCIDAIKQRAIHQAQEPAGRRSLEPGQDIQRDQRGGGRQR